MNKHSINEILKKAYEFSFDLVTDVTYNNRGEKKVTKRKAIFIHHLRNIQNKKKKGVICRDALHTD